MRRVSNGTALLGGSPFRLVRLSGAGSRLLDSWLEGSAEPLTPTASALLDRLTKAGMVHPVPNGEQPLPTFAFVVPVYDDAAGLGALLGQLRAEFREAHVVVVDDHSDNAQAMVEIAAEHHVDLARHQANRGPAAARNTGWRRVLERSTVAPQVIVFVDADVVPTAGSIAIFVSHLTDPGVAVAAPRVCAAPGVGTLASYESMSSPLDLGDASAMVKPGNPVSYVPSAALAVRASALVAADGFDESMRVGEDVDLIWRLTSAGHVVRYEPRAIVHHRSRDSVAMMLRQRFSYGSSAAALAAHHGDAVTPLRMPVTVLAAWAAALTGRRMGVVGACIGAVVSIATLANKFEGKVEHAPREAAAVIASVHTGVAGALVNAAARSYLPLMLLTRHTRRLALLAATVAPLLRWVRVRPQHDPVTHVALKAAEDAAYCAGVWIGAWRQRSLAALLPAIQLRWKQHD